MNLREIKKLNIPKTPGSYQFKNKAGKIIYIGKASNLASRMRSYWQKSANHTPAKEKMLEEIASVEWIKADSEIEALLLEANLIKKHQPLYNVVSRDDKRYAYIKISTEEEWPRIFFTRRLDKAGRYFGPFVSAEATRHVLKAIRKIWPYRSCARLPKKTCLYYRLRKCPGMCEQKISKSDYKKIIRQVILFLEGGKKQAVKEMKKDNSGHQFKNIKQILDNANIISLIDKYAADVVELAKILRLPRVPERIEGYDISNIFGRQAVGSMVVFKNGEPAKSQYRKFKIKKKQGRADDINMLKEVLARRLKNDWPKPDLIIIDGGKAQLNAAIRTLKKQGLDVPALAVSKGQGLRSARAPDKIFWPGEKKALELPLASPALHIIKRVRDEAHRFAISYHRLLRNKKIRSL